MKKLVCVLVCVVLLFAFAPFAAGNNLQAQGEALLRDTMAIFASGEFTLRGEGFVVTRHNGMMAVDQDVYFFGQRINLVVVGNRSYVVFPDSQRYVHNRLMQQTLDSLHVNWQWRLLTSAQVYTRRPLVTQVTIGGNRYIRAYVGDRAFYFRNGQLRRMSARYWADTFAVALTRGADAELFNFAAMRRTSLVSLPFARPIALVDDAVHQWTRR